jgi:hypothetical protein
MPEAFFAVNDIHPTIAVDDPPYFILHRRSGGKPLHLKIKRWALNNLRDEIDLRLKEYPEGGLDP